MNTIQKRELQRLDQAFVDNPWSKYRRKMPLRVGDQLMTVSLMRSGVFGFYASVFGKSAQAKSPSEAFLKLAARIQGQ